MGAWLSLSTPSGKGRAAGRRPKPEERGAAHESTATGGENTFRVRKPPSQALRRLLDFFTWAFGLGVGGLALFALALGGLQLYRLATTSDFFAIHRIEIRGAVHVKRDALLAATGLREGSNSLTVNIADVEESVRANPWVAEAAVKRLLPDAFEIRIRERAPVFWMRKDGTLYYADNKGEVIAPVGAMDFLSLPALEILPGGETLLPRLEELSRAVQTARLPVSMAGVSLFRVSAARGFEVFIENRNLVLCIAAGDWDANLRRLGEVLADLARRGELRAAREVWAADGNVWVVGDEAPHKEKQLQAGSGKDRNNG